MKNTVNPNASAMGEFHQRVVLLIEVTKTDFDAKGTKGEHQHFSVACNFSTSACRGNMQHFALQDKTDEGQRSHKAAVSSLFASSSAI